MTPVVWHVSQAAQQFPDRKALICVPSGREVRFGELEANANRVAHALRGLGLRAGDCVALCLSNGPGFVAAMLGAQRIGLYYTLISPKASGADLHFIVTDSGSRLLLAEPGSTVDALPADRPYLIMLSVDDIQEPGPWEALVACQSDCLPDDAQPGMEMMYSSGSTGRPKGIRRPPICKRWDEPDPRNVDSARSAGVTSESVYLSTSPLYHAAPHRYLLAFLHAGATTVLMEHFDARLALEMIDRHACTHSVWVPTMFSRMLRLEEATRAAYSGRSMVCAIHGAAPCPPQVKRAMIDWWGQILVEYYSGSEGIGLTLISSQEWLAHPGSVGRPRGCVAHVLDGQARELPPGEIGTIYFDSPVRLQYWRDPEKTRAVTSPQGWRTFGDVGYVDVDGYVYLTDRQDFMVISGGVNIYPQEIENTLMSHDAVSDVAVLGVADEDLGERLVAVVQPSESVKPDAALARELQGFCRVAGGSIKVPKDIRFMAAFPRLDNGKIQKRRLRDLFPTLPAPA
jgi:long-chain acyl-CoA synthetase